MILFFDCETTGKADLRSPPDADYQPRIVQLAAVLSDDEGKEVGCLNVIVKPDGFEIPQEASAIHGITTEKAMACGIPRVHALLAFAAMANVSTDYCAHNADFDTFVLRGECLRMCVEFLDKPTCCTMKRMTDICQIPGPYGFKWPRLQEAYKHAFQKTFEGAHDALSDVRACKDIYFWIQKLQPA